MATMTRRSPRFLIHDSESYSVTSSKLGDALLVRKSDGWNLYFQPGDDANCLIDKLDIAEDINPDIIDDILSGYDHVLCPPEKASV